MSTCASLPGQITALVEAAITAEMRQYGCYSDGNGGYWHPKNDLGGNKQDIPGPGQGPSDEPFFDQTGQAHYPQEIYSRWFDACHDLFGPWLGVPRKADFEPGATAVETAASYLTGGGLDLDKSDDTSVPLAGRRKTLDHLESARSTLEEFDGELMYTFKTNYLFPLQNTVVPGHLALVCALLAALRTEQALWQRVEQDICGILDGAVTSMKSAPDFTTISELLESISVLTTLASFFPPLGKAISTVSTVTGLVETFSGANQEKKEVPFSGSTAAEVFASVQKGVEELKTGITKAESGLGAFLGKLDASIETGAYDLERASNTLLDADEKEDLFTRKDQISIDSSAILQVARKALPAISTNFNKVSDELAGAIGQEAFARPAGIGDGASGPYAAWLKVALTIGGELDQTAEELRQSAIVLEAGAKAIDAVDADADKLLHKAHGDVEKAEEVRIHGGATN